MLAVLYLISHLDRANIGNAKIEGLTKDLELSGIQWNIVLSIFFVPYVLLGEYRGSIVWYRVNSGRGPQQYAPEELHQTVYLSWYPYHMLGNYHDLDWAGPELCWLDGHSCSPWCI
jgi:hypothetical protein